MLNLTTFPPYMYLCSFLLFSPWPLILGFSPSFTRIFSQSPPTCRHQRPTTTWNSRGRFSKGDTDGCIFFLKESPPTTSLGPLWKKTKHVSAFHPFFCLFLKYILLLPGGSSYFHLACRNIFCLALTQNACGFPWMPTCWSQRLSQLSLVSVKISLFSLASSSFGGICWTMVDKKSFFDVLLPAY